MTKVNDLRDVYIREFYQSLDCPRALTAWLLYSNNEHSQLANLAFNPLDHNDLVSARDSLCATKFLSKAIFLKVGNDLKETAKEKFFEAELHCRDTNRRLRLARKGQMPNRAAACLLSMQWKISQILGSSFGDGLFPSADEIVDAANWGPGATVSIPKRQATHPEKFHTECDITTECRDLVGPWISAAYPSWDLKLRVCDANKVVTVPKDAKTDRTIAIEPGINLWFQKAVGTVMRKRLKRIGIDLNEQAFNQKKSRLASKFNNLATVDFSMASDTVSSELVSEVMPPLWYCLLSSLRSAHGVFDGKLLTYEKFSSMGNGFTFELETLIFYTMACYCCEAVGASCKEVSVYGDDVVIPSSAYDLYCEISEELGFRVNRSKSYNGSYYRESCGSHWWNGADIKPIFQKGDLCGHNDICRAANAVRVLAHRRNTYGCDRALFSVWRLLVVALGKDYPRIPPGFGDMGIICNIDDPYVTYTRPKHGIEGFYVRVIATVASQHEIDHGGLLLFKLKSIGSSDSVLRPELGCSGNKIPLPLRVRNVRKNILFPRWGDLGPWL